MAPVMHRLFDLAILCLLAVTTVTARSSAKPQHRVLNGVRGGDAPPKPDLPFPAVPAVVPASSPASAPVGHSAQATHVAAADAVVEAVVEARQEAPLLPPAPVEAPVRVPTAPVQGTPAPTKSLAEVMGVAWRRALGGGIPGAIAGAVQVILLMWLRTTTNYQYRYGATTRQAMSILYKQGGLGRFYDGVGFALLQGPLSRFGSTAANEGVLVLLKNLQLTKSLPLPVTTAIASLAAGAWRIVLMPIDTCKVILQVEGNEGFKYLMRRVKQGEVSVLYQGAAATCVATIVGHWPWFVVYNWLNKRLEVPKGEDKGMARLLRSAFIGFAASVVSDSSSNCIRVLKITKQASASMASVSYTQALRTVLAADGWTGLMGRGLMTRIIGNGIQSMLFTVIWRYLQDHKTFAAKDAKDRDDDDNSSSIKAPLRVVETKSNSESSPQGSGSA